MIPCFSTIWQTNIIFINFYTDRQFRLGSMNCFQCLITECMQTRYLNELWTTCWWHLVLTAWLWLKEGQELGQLTRFTLGWTLSQMTKGSCHCTIHCGKSQGPEMWYWNLFSTVLAVHKTRQTQVLKYEDFEILNHISIILTANDKKKYHKTKKFE